MQHGYLNKQASQMNTVHMTKSHFQLAKRSNVYDELLIAFAVLFMANPHQNNTIANNFCVSVSFFASDKRTLR